MSVPQVVILIRVEDGRPRVYVDAVSEGECLRLEDWLARRPELAELLRLALDLQDEERAA
jgi:hypothetical protein